MPYDHSNKVGNQGDLIKHFVLATVIKNIKPKHSAFNYFEVHTGYAEYSLEDTGAWQQGIGKFISTYCNTSRSNDEFNYFIDHLNLENINSDKRYLGSSKIVEKCMRDNDTNEFKFFLCDTNPEVCKQLEASYAGYNNVHITCADGYNQAKQFQHADLVFIDPPDIDKQYKAYIDLIQYLYAQNTWLVSWNSLHGNTATPRQH